MELFRSLQDRAKKLADDARRLADEHDLKGRADAAAASLQAARDRLVPEPVRERMEALRDALHEGSDRAAEAVAAKVSELRGAEVTPEQVKQVALRIGVALVAAGAASAIADALAGGEGALVAGEGAGDGAPAEGEVPAAEGGSGDAVSDVRMRLAKHGHSVNISTTVVDGDGCLLDAGG